MSRAEMRVLDGGRVEDLGRPFMASSGRVVLLVASGVGHGVAAVGQERVAGSAEHAGHVTAAIPAAGQLSRTPERPPTSSTSGRPLVS